MKKKLLFFVGVLVLMFALTACGGNDDDTTPGPDAPTRGDWREPFPETITVTTASGTHASAVFPDGYSVHHTPWYGRWLREYNVNVEVDWISEDYTLQMNLSIAADTLPDVFSVNNLQFMQLLEAGMLEDMTHAVYNYSSPSLMRHLTNDQLIFETGKVDGRVYGIPHLFWGYVNNSPYFWVRNDWYLEAGSPEINTLADLEDFMAYLTETHDSVDHVMTFNYGLNSFWNSTQVWHAHTRGDGTRMWLDDGQGGIISGYEQPELVDAIAAWRRWFDMGWVRPDFATADWGSMQTELATGRAAVEFGQSWRAWAFTGMVENFGYDAYMIALPMPTIDGQQAQIPIHFPNSTYTVARRGFQHTAVIPVLTSDFVYVMTEAGLGDSMTVEEIMPFTTNNIQHATGPFRITFVHHYDVLEVLDAMDAYHEGTLDDFVFTIGDAPQFVSEIRRWVSDRDTAGFGRFGQMGHRSSAYARGLEYIYNDMLLFTSAWGAPPQEVLDLGSITDSIIEEGITRIIMGLDPIEHWPNVLEEWRAAGGAIMTEAVNRDFAGR